MRNFIITLSVLLLFVQFTGSRAFAGASDTTSSRCGKIEFYKDVSWRELYFQGGKGFTRLAASVRLRSSRKFCPCELTDTLSGFITCPLEGEDLKVLSVETTLSTLIPPQEEYAQHVWFNTKASGALQRIRWKKGPHPWVKAYRWGEKGVSRLKIQPASPSEVTKNPGIWTKKRRSFFGYSRGAEDCPTISEPTLLFYLLSSIDTKRSRFPLELCVFGKKELHLVTVRLVKLKPLKISFESYGLQGERRIEKNIRPLVFFITASPDEENEEGRETFSLLGLREDIYIFLDPETRLPVRVIGKTKKFGDMVLALTGAWLR